MDDYDGFAPPLPSIPLSESGQAGVARGSRVVSSKSQGVRTGKASRSGALEIIIIPPKGWSSSRMRKIAPETERAQMTSDARVVAFAGAMRAKPANKMIIQNSRTAKKGMGI
jgi:hypothetical protein